MSRLGKLVATVLCVGLAAPAAAVAEPIIRGNVEVHVDLPKVIIRDQNRPPPRGYVRFDDYRSYDRVERVRVPYDVSGEYDSTFGSVTLTQEGNRVTGHYVAGGGGMIKGKIRNGVLYYRWKQNGAEGRGVWYLNKRRGEVAGTWGTFDSASNAGQWNLRKAGVSHNDRRDRRWNRR